MRKIIFLFFLFSVFAQASDLKQLTFVNGCTLISWEGVRFRVFPGMFCQFMDDGSFFTANSVKLNYMSKDSEIKWEFKRHIHHQVNLTADLQKILLMSSDFSKKNEKGYRIDRLIILNRDGKILHEQSAADLMQQIRREGYSKSELTHFNSFYEIPEVTGKAPSYIKAGNFVVNSHRGGVFFLSPDLKKVLHFKRLATSDDHQIHDVQVLKNGHLLYFNNSHVQMDNGISFSAIEELDLNSENLVFEFRSKPEGAFYSRFCGGVQKIDEDRMLFSHMLTGTYIYSSKRKDFEKYLFQTHVGEFEKFYPTQQVKLVDLRAFLSHWKSSN